MFGYGPAMLNKPSPQYYRCLTCDVYGKGDECWMCGKTDNLKLGCVLVPTCPHHYNGATTRVSVGNGEWSIRRELTNLI